MKDKKNWHFQLFIIRICFHNFVCQFAISASRKDSSILPFMEMCERSKEKKKNGMRDYNSDTIIVTSYQYYSMHRISK